MYLKKAVYFRLQQFFAAACCSGVVGGLVIAVASLVEHGLQGV